MASIPQFYSDYTPTGAAMFPNDLYDLPPPTTPSTAGTPGGPFWGEETLVPLFHEFGLLHPPSLSPSSQYCCDDKPPPPLSSAIDPTSFPQLNIPSINGGRQNSCLDHHFHEFQDDCFGLVPEIKPLHQPLPPHNWEIQSNEVPVAEDSNMKVGRYSEEVRKQRILRYLKKRNQRNFTKTIKYACRKTLADRRIRVRGRFARNNEACDQEPNPAKNDTCILHMDNELVYNHELGVQMKKDEEEWEQEMRSLMYLPYINS
ncbi:uncharacterized protein LOC111776500 [Cucurbita pepo subsp. pepo]|uniref:uncharacterized protein LOC111776500 n=1 Tax=Cucurbita pepo subsp. pepo TaxID=3664 RepID=UPI000C9D564E|nr:uncharacterized protein LOC111776500 [Cucurbita pepo subsp. pepo]